MEVFIVINSDDDDNNKRIHVSLGSSKQQPPIIDLKLLSSPIHTKS